MLLPGLFMRLASLLALTLLFFPSFARADEPARLTDRGRIMPGGSVGGYVASNQGTGLYSYADCAAWLQPSLVYFVRDHIGLGA